MNDISFPLPNSIKCLSEVPVSLPFYMTVSDYHEFKPVTNFLSSLVGKSVKHKELGYQNGYLGIIFLAEQEASLRAAGNLEEMEDE